MPTPPMKTTHRGQNLFDSFKPVLEDVLTGHKCVLKGIGLDVDPKNTFDQHIKMGIAISTLCIGGNVISRFIQGDWYNSLPGEYGKKKELSEKALGEGRAQYARESGTVAKYWIEQYRDARIPWEFWRITGRKAIPLPQRLRYLEQWREGRWKSVKDLRVEVTKKYPPTVFIQPIHHVPDNKEEESISDIITTPDLTIPNTAAITARVRQGNNIFVQGWDAKTASWVTMLNGVVISSVSLGEVSKKQEEDFDCLWLVMRELSISSESECTIDIPPKVDLDDDWFDRVDEEEDLDLNEPVMTEFNYDDFVEDNL